MLKKSMIGIGVFAVLLAAFAYAGPGNSAEGETTRERVPLDSSVYVPCIDEVVVLWGHLNTVTSIRTDANGGVHVHTHFNPQGGRGVGQETGIQYRGVGATNASSTARGDYPLVITEVNNFRLIAPGPGNDLHVHAVTHTTINANGEVTTEVQVERVTCGQGG